MKINNDKPFGIAVVGLGTVGSGLISILEQNKDIITARTGREFQILAVSAKNKKKKRTLDLEHLNWIENPLDVTKLPDIHCVVELVGGYDGIAKELIFKALEAGKMVVTANKALLAHHGHEIARRAEQNGVNVYFEAAVAGGIPIVKTMLESLSPNKTKKIFGVINGTCNYILTEMEKNSTNYDEVFKKAKNLGYVETDPELDIGGIDTAHKLVLLSNIAFNQKIDLKNVSVDGIKDISLFDINSAKELGFKIKLLATAKITDSGSQNEVAPCLIPIDSPIAQVFGSENIVSVDNNFLGQTYYRGAGAGAGPTASAVMADLINISRDAPRPVFGVPEKKMKVSRPSENEFQHSFYIRIIIKDEPGALSHITGILADHEISINRMRQKDHKGREAPIVLLTHETAPLRIKKCINQLTKNKFCIGKPIFLKVEDI